MTAAASTNPGPAAPPRVRRHQIKAPIKAARTTTTPTTAPAMAGTLDVDDLPLEGGTNAADAEAEGAGAADDELWAPEEVWVTEEVWMEEGRTMGPIEIVAEPK